VTGIWQEWESSQKCVQELPIACRKALEIRHSLYGRAGVKIFVYLPNWVENPPNSVGK
jgi:hypothetical protein